MSSREGQTPEYPTAEEWAERFSEAVLKPLRDVGELLARDVDATNARIAVLVAEIAELGRQVDELRVAAGVEAGEHSVRAGRSFYPAFCRVCGHGWESVEELVYCPECHAAGSDVVAGPLTTVVQSPAAGFVGEASS